MPTIRSVMPYRPGPTLPCVWCGDPTDVKAETPFRPDLGSVPLHVLCGTQVLLAYEQWRAGRVLTQAQQQGIHRLRTLPNAS
ncbi:MAG: hypothetical protein LC798_11065 [Chloroflexi bacterium]|nr:hypothetical protein [Chloroflexota bacterium]